MRSNAGIFVIRIYGPTFQWHRKRKRRSCGQCQACQCRRDCGTCDFCVDKPKFGGSNKKRQKCRLRQCQRQAMVSPINNNVTFFVRLLFFFLFFCFFAHAEIFCAATGRDTCYLSRWHRASQQQRTRSFWEGRDCSTLTAASQASRKTKICHPALTFLTMSTMISERCVLKEFI